MYADALTTKARVKERIGANHTNFDTLLDRLILAVTARIEQMTDRRFVQGTFTNELHDGSDTYGSRRSFLIVKNAPLASVSSIEYDAGTPGSPDWVSFDENEYRVNLLEGTVFFPNYMPRGFQNIRITYTGGFSGFAYGIENYWVFNSVPEGAVDGSNLTFALGEHADQIIVYADGVREAAANITFAPGTDNFTLALGRAPNSTIAVDYLRTETDEEEQVGTYLPEELVDVCERAVIALFKRRESEGKTSETFQESSITWRDSMFSAEDRATIKNYRRGYSL